MSKSVGIEKTIEFEISDKTSEQQKLVSTKTHDDLPIESNLEESNGKKKKKMEAKKPKN